jgi:hypothetical protein
MTRVEMEKLATAGAENGVNFENVKGRSQMPPRQKRGKCKTRRNWPNFENVKSPRKMPNSDLSFKRRRKR